MAIKEILRLGNPQLREISRPVPQNMIGSKTLSDLLTDLKDTKAHYGEVGMAAPQIGVGLRVFILGNSGPSESSVFINPTWDPINQETGSYLEGDLESELAYEGSPNVGELRGRVRRFTLIRYTALNENGIPFEKTISGLHARIFQREFDHLEGLLFVDKVQDTRTLGFTPELIAANLIT